MNDTDVTTHQSPLRLLHFTILIVYGFQHTRSMRTLHVTTRKELEQELARTHPRGEF